MYIICYHTQGILDWFQPITMYNEGKFRQSLLVQLCDEAGNATHEAGVRVQLARDPGIRVSSFFVCLSLSFMIFCKNYLIGNFVLKVLTVGKYEIVLKY